ncbi:MAG: hypothetical protein EOS20_27660 [Mesorhizobium sp.]|nr:hypothetical protein EOA28_10605 [Mesorhizobium sp. M2A.F.Ca.ET.067.02.1.1]RWB85629.1 MAG: hypothetical protein EOQ51_15555 [Mesorhizobium sp.]TGP98507.1 hypothetical protein EN861_08735 [Mesorhizobium sp. M8A.F.Ca.ET.218.01.1.1]TGS41615.1 hypothetical protein EN825_21505 [Mesorhizobium sp. M8A.F.Ca.ET.182.01.1.1]TGS79298.1 hypothetical protein EN824_18920 [Mesorhizobium sp. M8A.F.Ca.ET.181.01.1.1]TGT19852.1 hypothetical protein EN856_08745 [Mesorhizobium sp. M8A.F.Ca.ET.213.01.1.1]TGU8841
MKTWGGATIPGVGPITARAIRQGLANINIQTELTAAAVNLKRTAALFDRFLGLLLLMHALNLVDETRRGHPVVPTPRPPLSRVGRHAQLTP